MASENIQESSIVTTPENILWDILGHAIVTVVVGEGPMQETFSVHEELICRRSEYFHDEMKNKRKKSNDRTIQLSQEDPKVFALYLQACYANHVSVEFIRGTDKNNTGASIVLWGQLYALAETLMDIQTRNVVTRAVYNAMRILWTYPHETISMVQNVWSSVPHSRPFLRLLVDISAHHFHPWLGKAILRSALEKLPAEFRNQLTLSLLYDNRKGFGLWGSINNTNHGEDVHQYLEPVKNKGKGKERVLFILGPDDIPGVE